MKVSTRRSSLNLQLLTRSKHVRSTPLRTKVLSLTCIRYIGGSYLRTKEEQYEALEFLKGFGTRSGWQTAHIAKALSVQWEERSRLSDTSHQDIFVPQ